MRNKVFGRSFASSPHFAIPKISDGPKVKAFALVSKSVGLEDLAD